MNHRNGHFFSRAIRIAAAAAAVCVWAGLSLGPLRAQQAEADPLADLKKEVEELKRGQADILRQLSDIKRLLQTRAAAPSRPAGPNVEGTVFSLGNHPFKGENTAPLTLVEFTDYQ